MNASSMLSLMMFVAATPVVLVAMMVAGPAQGIGPGNLVLIAVLAAAVLAILVGWATQRTLESELKRLDQKVDASSAVAEPVAGSAQELAQINADFVCGISHELRTPLSSIKAYVEMLVDGEAESEHAQIEFYNIIHSETNRLSRLIDNVLSISRIESGMIKAHREPIAIASVVRDTIDIMRPQARARDLRVRVAPVPDAAVVNGDRDMLHQALINLFGNAIKYTPAGGEVAIETAVHPAQQLVHLSVVDTGLGIPGESMPFIFDKFYRVPEHRRVAKGTGLGLNLVKHVVETVHEGRVRVTSEPGGGSRFTITLAQVQEACPTRQAAELVLSHGEWS